MDLDVPREEGCIWVDQRVEFGYDLTVLKEYLTNLTNRTPVRVARLDVYGNETVEHGKRA